MDLRAVLQAVWRNWWLVAGALLAALGVAGVVTALAVPQYATSTTFFVTAPGEGVSDTYHGSLLSEQRVASYAHLFRGDLARTVARADGIGLTPEQIRARISSQVVPSTILLEVVVTDTDPARSERIAQVLSREFISLVAKLETPPDQSGAKVNVEVVAGPKLDPAPVSPKPLRNIALAVGLGLLLGVAGAILRHGLDATVKSAEVLQQVAAAPVLSVVPFDSGAKKGAPLVAASYAVESTSRRRRSYSGRREAFRHLRTNLQFVDVGRPAKVIVVTSSVLEEGKSTTATNLAIAFAEAGHRVVLVEADLRRPRVAQYLGLPGGDGLTDLLTGGVGLDAALQRWGLHELYVLPSGPVPPNPSELLASGSMAALLERLRETFDVVIVDTPPVLPFTDAAVVAAAADGAVLVVRSGRTHQGRVRSAVASLRAVDARLLGCVLNMQAQTAEESYYRDGYRTLDQGHPVSPAPAVASPAGYSGASATPTPEAAAGPAR